MTTFIKLILFALLVTSCAGQSRTISSSDTVDDFKVPFHYFKYDTIDGE
ncbi:MAG: hypothetical protein KAG61_13740 [Bacteriovoracaceae bacterium]|nr:hypothetical protein [Bacteriovoracaceae bacterium]